MSYEKQQLENEYETEISSARKSNTCVKILPWGLFILALGVVGVVSAWGWNEHSKYMELKHNIKSWKTELKKQVDEFAARHQALIDADSAVKPDFSALINLMISDWEECDFDTVDKWEGYDGDGMGGGDNKLPFGPWIVNGDGKKKPGRPRPHGHDSTEIVDEEK